MGSGGLTISRRVQNAGGRPSRYAPPAVSGPLLQWFLRYARFYVSRHMHSVRVSQEHHLLQVVGRPLVLYMNHPSWWDPMIAAVLAAQYLPSYLHYAPIDADALKKYRFFRKLGFFGMKQGNFDSQRRLLDIARQVLSQGGAALWITPQSRFSDVRERPLQVGSGLPHLVRKAPQCAVLPVAIEYTFWQESKPEVLVRFGGPVEGQQVSVDPHAAQSLELALERVLDELSEAAIARDECSFRVILSGKSGVGGVYDLWGRGRALLKGSAFRPEHGDIRR